MVMTHHPRAHAPRDERSIVHPAALRAYLDQHRGELAAMLARPGSGGMALARRHADIADDLLKRLYSASAAHAETETSLLMGAVGGYGRQLLGMKSDLDVCFVTAEGPDAVLPLVEAILYPLWDAGLNVGHQIVGIADVVADAMNDLPTATELLDFRPLSGNMSLLRVVQESLSAGLFCDAKLATFIARLEEHASARHDHFGDSVYLLEPDVKNGTGGLRDLDLALWAARARFGSGDLKQLRELDLLTSEQLSDALRALDFVWTVRNHLHHNAGRRVDRLTFGEQESVARALGYGERIKGEPESELQRTGEMVETFMSDYYRHARVITQTRDRILGRAKRRVPSMRPIEQPLGEDFVICEGRLGLTDPESLLRGEPSLALRIYAAAVARDMQLLGRTRDAIASASRDARFCQQLRDSREAAQLFVKLVCTCRSVSFPSGSILAELHDVGLLLALIPEFAPVVGRVHHDLYHVYTVDVHSIAAVDRLRTLTRGDQAALHPLPCRLAAELARPRVLFLATLLHDIGKVLGGHDHAQRGADMARPILERLGLANDEIEDACHLVLKHLAMYVAAARRDLADPATLAEFVREVRGREGLRELYLLTIADVSTTSPTSMTKWKASMLDGLLHACDAALAGADAGYESRVAEVRAKVRALWMQQATASRAAGQSIDPGALEQYLGSMPERYLLSNPAREIAAHATLAIGPRESPVSFALVPSHHEDVVELCVVTEGRSSAGLCVVAGDRPGLLAAISAAISASRLEIQAAQVNSRPLPSGDFQAVDLFWVRGDAGDLSLKLDKFQHDLNAVVAGHVAPGSLVKVARSGRWSSRPTPAVFTEIVFDHRGSAEHTIIEVLTQDRPALLFSLAQALHTLGISIGVAKISTEGTRAIDVFYVTEADGTKLHPGERSEQTRQTLLQALTALDEASAA
jgi:[protein-PII] uridylyltransferase